ncbi:hypothetical protein BGZ95_009178 [Linnemannia exigua]|uniref:MD-2-related lipid-recognition domain-containing protein n=1 Tax=Linnemannia exigua TaxID=604196 RepID=A0AAD4DDB3_9FUNG|nr:hypothetical protein BGZ95_009178 [Linnemannia exigua]
MKFTASLAVLSTAFVSAVLAQTGSFEDFSQCASYPTQMALSYFKLSPFPMCINKTYTLTATGYASEPIVNGATLAVTGRYLGRLVYTDKKTFEELLAPSGQSIPIPAGPVTLDLSLLLKPNRPPNVLFHFQFVATNGDGALLFCQAAGLSATNCP